VGITVNCASTEGTEDGGRGGLLVFLEDFLDLAPNW